MVSAVCAICINIGTSQRHSGLYLHGRHSTKLDPSGAAYLAGFRCNHIHALMNSAVYLNDWSFRLQRFLFQHRRLFALSRRRFVFRSKKGDYLCGLQWMDFGLKNWAFCITDLTAEKELGVVVAQELRDYALSRGAEKCLVLFSPNGWPKEPFSLQQDGILWLGETGEKGQGAEIDVPPLKPTQ
jgi:hypothetical protein